MKEWDDHQTTLPPAQRAGPVQQKPYDTTSFMNISGGKYKGRVLGVGSLSSTFVKCPTDYIQTETSSSYASTDRSHRPSVDNLDQLNEQWASEKEEKTQQLIQAAIDKLNEEWKQKFQEQQQQFQQQQFSFPSMFHQEFPPRPQYLHQQPLFQQQQNYSQYSQQQQLPPNFQQQHQDPPISAFQQQQQQMFQQQQYFFIIISMFRHLHINFLNQIKLHTDQLCQQLT
ncbi:uncharacterized protein [Cicer arietinum]|uniref:uncharacterized protein n=1 Tax=Cicer arietinum TaxID=3827 RepID=UPI003CC6AEF7